MTIFTYVYDPFFVDEIKKKSFTVSLRIQVCPRDPGFYLQSYDLGMGFRPSILLDWEGSGFLGYICQWNAST